MSKPLGGCSEGINDGAGEENAKMREEFEVCLWCEKRLPAKKEGEVYYVTYSLFPQCKKCYSKRGGYDFIWREPND